VSYWLTALIYSAWRDANRRGMCTEVPEEFVPVHNFVYQEPFTAGWLKPTRLGGFVREGEMVTL